MSGAAGSNPMKGLGAALLQRPKALAALCALGMAGTLCSGFLLVDPYQSEGFEVLLRDAPDPGEVLRLSEVLCKEGIENRIEDGGRTLSVVSERHHEAVRRIMEEGLQPTEERGGESFFGLGGGLEVGGEDARARHRRSREQELARTLALYPAVQFARVHLNLPEESTFGEEPAPPSASVFLGLKPFRRLSAAQARAIRGLVAHAVKGLQVERVILADSRGSDYAALEREEETRELHRVGERLGVLRDAEERAEAKLLRHLGPVLGRRNVSVSVATTLQRVEGAPPDAVPVAYRSLMVTVNTRSLQGHGLTTSFVTRVRRSAARALGLRDEEHALVTVEGAEFQGEAEEPVLPPAPEPLEGPGPEKPCPTGTGGGALPIGILLLGVGTLGVLSITRNAPCPGDLPGSRTDVDPVGLGQDAGLRRCSVACWAEDDPEFAARVLARLVDEGGQG